MDIKHITDEAIGGPRVEDRLASIRYLKDLAKAPKPDSPRDRLNQLIARSFVAGRSYGQAALLQRMISDPPEGDVSQKDEVLAAAARMARDRAEKYRVERADLESVFAELADQPRGPDLVPVVNACASSAVQVVPDGSYVQLIPNRLGEPSADVFDGYAVVGTEYFGELLSYSGASPAAVRLGTDLLSRYVARHVPKPSYTGLAHLGDQKTSLVKPHRELIGANEYLLFSALRGTEFAEGIDPDSARQVRVMARRQSVITAVNRRKAWSDPEAVLAIASGVSDAHALADAGGDLARKAQLRAGYQDEVAQALAIFLTRCSFRAHGELAMAQPDAAEISQRTLTDLFRAIDRPPMRSIS